MKIICPYCQKLAYYGDNKIIYGKNYGKSYKCYYCSDCDAYVGVHNNGREPLGTMANKELRGWRIKTHNILDPIWQSGNITRGKLYGFLKQHFGKEIHVGESDIITCKRIITFLEFCKTKSKNNY